jgi:hypothetical protein
MKSQVPLIVRSMPAREAVVTRQVDMGDGVAGRLPMMRWRYIVARTPERDDGNMMVSGFRRGRGL